MTTFNKLFLSLLCTCFISNVQSNNLKFNITIYGNTNNTNNTYNTYNSYSLNNEVFGFINNYEQCPSYISHNMMYEYKCSCADNVETCNNNFVNSPMFKSIVYNNISLYKSCNFEFNSNNSNTCLQCNYYNISYNYKLSTTINCPSKKMMIVYLVLIVLALCVFIVFLAKCFKCCNSRRQYTSLNNYV